jgi:hypothetical protein
VAHLNYKDETIAINSIVKHLQGPIYVQAVARLGLAPWVNRLEELNDQFNRYDIDAEDAQMSKPKITARESRKQTDVALRKITTRIEALANLNGQEDCLPFADAFNEQVEIYNTLLHEHYGRIHARIDISDANVDPIEPVAYTGKPVFVIPVVKLRTTVDGKEKMTELVFTHDFTAIFKNNIEKGMASITIQGIGDYKGQIVTTFYID